MLKNWLKIFLFNLKRSKLFSLLTIIGLSIGICATILTSLYWKQEHSYDLWNPDKDVIYEVLMDMGENKVWSSNVGPLAGQMQAANEEIVEYMYYQGWVYSFSFKINGNVKTTDGHLVQRNFFEFFPFEIVAGSKQSFAEKKQTIALSEEEAIRLFGKENPIGKSITNEENKTFTITTVYKVNEHSTFTAKAIVNDIQVDETNWNNFDYQLLIKLKKQEDITKVESVTNDIVQKNLIEDYAKKRGLTVESYKEKFGDIVPIFSKLTDARLNMKYSGLPNHGGSYKLLYLNAVASLLILILSIVNQINLSTAYALKRIKEFGVRRILGASKKNIIFQVLFETSIYIFVSILLGFALVEILLPYYNDFLQHKLKFGILDNLLFVIGIFFFMLFSAAFLPALYIANIDIQNTLKNNSIYRKTKDISRQSLLVLQFIISFLFICLGLVIYKQVNFMMSKDLGFKGEQVIAINYYNYEKEDRYAYYEKIAEQIRKLKGVNTVAASNLNIGSGSPQSSPMFYKDNHVQTRIVFTEYDLIPLFDISIIEGRNLDRNITSDSLDNILVNETLVKELDIKGSPINQSIKWNNAMYNIIGVVKDFNVTGFSQKNLPNIFVHGGSKNYIRNNINSVFVKLEAQDIEKSIANLEKHWNTNVDPFYPFEYEFVNKQFQRTYIDYVKQRNLFLILNITVISIALFGLFSLASFSIEKRLKEIAIKKVLGADTKELITDLCKRYIILCIVSFFMAILPSYYIIQEWLANFEYRIEIDYSIFLISFLIMLVLTLILVVNKGYAATKINPLHYLKYE